MKPIRIILSLLAAGTLVTACLKDEALKLPYSGYIPGNTGDGWEISTPSEEGMDASALQEVYLSASDAELYPNIRSLLIIRNGKLVSEAYFKDAGDRDRIMAVMSVTKSITSLITGMAIDMGYLSSLDEKVYNLIPEYFDEDPHKKCITIRQLLTMETGLDFDNDIHTGEMIYYRGNSLEYILSKPMVFEPGADWYYGDGNPQLMSGIITRLSGKTMEEYAEEYLFGPMNITDFFWESHSDGLTLGGMGLWLKPRDMARIGRLMLNEGNWEGRQLVSKDWIAASTVRQAGHHDYGYYWLTSENTFFWASGKGGQLIWLYPEKKIAVVLTSDSFSRSWLLSRGSYDHIFKGIFEAILD